jgi:hypothetical protein
MTDRIRRVQYFYFEVPDQPGEGARLFEKLKDAQVNLVAFTSFPTGGGRSQVDVVPEDPAAFLDATKRLGMKHSPPKEAFLIQGGDRVGAVADILKRLGAAKVNATAGNASVAQGGGFGMILWVKPQDVAAAARALGV